MFRQVVPDGQPQLVPQHVVPEEQSVPPQQTSVFAMQVVPQHVVPAPQHAVPQQPAGQESPLGNAGKLCWQQFAAG